MQPAVRVRIKIKEEIENYIPSGIRLSIRRDGGWGERVFA